MLSTTRVAATVEDDDDDDDGGSCCSCRTIEAEQITGDLDKRGGGGVTDKWHIPLIMPDWIEMQAADF